MPGKPYDPWYVHMLILNRARSRSSVHFVDELEEPHYRRRPRTLSRHSSEEEIIESRPRSDSRRRRRRRPVYFDGAADTQRDGISADRACSKEEVQNTAGNGGKMGIAHPMQGPMKSVCRRSSSIASKEFSPPITTNQAQLAVNSSPSASRASSYASHYARFEKRSQPLDSPSNGSFMPLNVSEAWRLTDRARVAFADPGYEVDSQFPSPPSVTFAVPVTRPSRSPSPLHVRTAPVPTNTRYSERVRRHTEPFNPAYSNDGVFTAVPRQTSYE